MAQHFLLSAKARTLSLAKVFRMGEDAAYGVFCDLRWADTDGDPVCPRCGCTEAYAISTRRKFKCVACHHQFSVTSGTIFASRKLSFTDLLAAIVLFVNGAKGLSALQASRDLDVQYKTAFVLFHKLREAMARELADLKLNGVVEIDGGYFGGYVKPANRKADRKDRRLKVNTSGKRQCVVIMRERNGRSLPSWSPARVTPCRWSAIMSAPSPRYMPMRVRAGMRFMPGGIPAASITALPLWTRAFAPIRRRAISAASAAWRLALTIISPALTFAPMPVRPRGARTTAARTTGHRL